jgi:hypothetical protein
LVVSISSRLWQAGTSARANAPASLMELLRRGGPRHIQPFMHSWAAQNPAAEIDDQAHVSATGSIGRRNRRRSDDPAQQRFAWISSISDC